MSTKVFIGVVVAVVLVILATAFFTAGDTVQGGQPHKCATSTNINDLFCREK